MLEDSRRESHDSEVTYLTHPSRSDSRKESNTRRQPDISRPHARRPDPKLPRPVALTKRPPAKKDPDILVRVGQLADELERLQAQLSLNSVKEEDSLSEEIADAVSNEGSDPEVAGFLLQKDALYSTADSMRSQSELIYDSGASRSTVCKYSILIDPMPLSKTLNTYGGKIQITHVGKLSIDGTLIYPVYYAP